MLMNRFLGFALNCTPHYRHDVVIWAHDHDLGCCCTTLQGKGWCVMLDGECLRVADHLAQLGSL